ncbi:MAG: hypothetical protein Q4C85_03800 [Actinomyces sp.]|uniref:hypothetical protein n=1 Tax=Actinomyces sp. TaxID=29317 RepID=UPI0026DD2044|nr:hypothetical protein [Actinomyces sp.]MDO4242871.1 hypothetical protein [Actinomyces sp.]
MSNTFNQFEALRARMDVFLGKLEQRGQDVGAEALATARDMKRSDPEEFRRSFAAFHSGITAQLMTLVAKAEAAFEEHFARFEDMEDDDVEQGYAALEERMEAWAEKMTWRAEHVFDDLADDDAQATWDAAVAEWKSLASRFTCPQCSAPVPVPELYTVSVYLPCQGCGTQVTFTPSETMQSAVIAAESIAEAKARPYQQAYEVGFEDPQVLFPEWLANLARSKAVEQAELEALVPMVAAKKFAATLDALSEHKDHPDDSVNLKFYPNNVPWDFQQVRLAYYGALAELAGAIGQLRAQGQPRAADLVRGMVPAFARPGCEVAAAVANDTYTEALIRPYLEHAATLNDLADEYGKPIVIH